MHGRTLVLLLAMAVPAAATPPDCKLHLVASLPLLDDRAGMPTVQATLGTKQVPMLVDTGGSYSMVAQHIVDELHPNLSRVRGAQFQLVDHTELKQIASIRPFALGEMTTHEFSFLVFPDGIVGPKYINGTIAPDILANFDVEFDFAHKKINLFSQDHCPGVVVYWTKDWAEIPFTSPDKMSITLPMTLDGKAVKADLDTGSSHSFMNASVAKDMFGVEAAGTGSFHHTFMSLSTDGVAIAHPEFTILADERSSAIGHYGRMLLGMTELRRFRLYVAYKEQVLYVTPADAH